MPAPNVPSVLRPGAFRRSRAIHCIDMELFAGESILAFTVRMRRIKEGVRCVSQEDCELLGPKWEPFDFILGGPIRPIPRRIITRNS